MQTADGRQLPLAKLRRVAVKTLAALEALLHVPSEAQTLALCSQLGDCANILRVRRTFCLAQIMRQQIATFQPAGHPLLYFWAPVSLFMDVL